MSAIFLLAPAKVKAAWPFSTPAKGAQAATPLVHDSSLALLVAATNPDPNPVKGTVGSSIVGGSALLADSGPSGTIADVVDSPSSNTISVYVVRPGDSLQDIASMFDVSVNTIIWANNLKSSKDISVGDTLVILPVSGVKYTISKGDTLATIAKKFNADAGEIAQYNGLDDSAALLLGSTIIIPGGEIEAPVVVSPIPTKKPTGVHGQTASGATPGSAHDINGPSLPGYFIDPVPGAILTQGLHGFDAVDLGAPTGTPIHAAAAGTAIIARTGGWNGGYGNYVVITHANGTQTLYAHMSRVVTSAGASVAQGEIIGYVGRSGDATGPHVHFEVRGARNPIAASCTVGAACSL